MMSVKDVMVKRYRLGGKKSYLADQIVSQYLHLQNKSKRKFRSCMLGCNGCAPAQTSDEGEYMLIYEDKNKIKNIRIDRTSSFEKYDSGKDCTESRDESFGNVYGENQYETEGEANEEGFCKTYDASLENDYDELCYDDSGNDDDKGHAEGPIECYEKVCSKNYSESKDYHKTYNATLVEVYDKRCYDDRGKVYGKGYSERPVECCEKVYGKVSSEREREAPVTGYCKTYDASLAKAFSNAYDKRNKKAYKSYCKIYDDSCDASNGVEIASHLNERYGYVCSKDYDDKVGTVYNKLSAESFDECNDIDCDKDYEERKEECYGKNNGERKSKMYGDRYDDCGCEDFEKVEREYLKLVDKVVNGIRHINDRKYNDSAHRLRKDRFAYIDIVAGEMTVINADYWSHLRKTGEEKPIKMRTDLTPPEYERIRAFCSGLVRTPLQFMKALNKIEIMHRAGLFDQVSEESTFLGKCNDEAGEAVKKRGRIKWFASLLRFFKRITGRQTTTKDRREKEPLISYSQQPSYGDLKSNVKSWLNEDQYFAKQRCSYGDADVSLSTWFNEND